MTALTIIVTVKLLSRFSLVVLVCASVVYAIYWGVGEWRYRALLADRVLSAGDRDISVKPERTCPDPAETLVFVIFGQSNAANHGNTRLTGPDAVFDFYGKRCFSGDDPQFSATSNGGSPWPAFAKALRDTRETRSILWANVAVGNTRADEWASGTANADRLRAETMALRKKGYRISAFLYFQGESDRETSGEAYNTELSGIAKMSDEMTPGTPLILSNSSICGAETKPAPALSAARAALAETHPNVYVGPDTDALGQEFRYDGCHMNETGLRATGKLWATHVSKIIGRVE